MFTLVITRLVLFGQTPIYSKFLRRLTLPIIGLIILSACSGEMVSPHSNVNVNVLDSLRFKDLVTIDNAQLKSRNTCMQDEGFTQYAERTYGPVANIGRGPRAQINDVIHLQGPRTAAEAKSVGFGRSANAEPPNVVSYDPSFDAAMNECTKESFLSLEINQSVLYSYGEVINNITSRSVHATQSVRVDFDRRIDSCLAGEGYTKGPAFNGPLPGLYGVKMGAVSGVETTWSPTKIVGTVQVGPAIPARPYVPSAEEVVFGIKYAACLDSSGVGVESETVLLEATAAVVAKYEDQISELNTKLDRAVRVAAKILAQ